MTNPRAFLSANPMTFNELLDLFETFLTTSYEITTEAAQTLHDDFGLKNNDVLGRIFGVAFVGGDMVRRLQQIRAERNAGSDVTITLTQFDACKLAASLDETDRMIAAASSVFELLYKRALANPDDMDSGAWSVMGLAHRAMSEVDASDGEQLRCFAARLRKASQYQFEQEKVA